MENRNTPGPWLTCHNIHGWSVHRVDHEQNLCDHICDVHEVRYGSSREYSKPRTIANAKLIAASPTLLEVCELAPEMPEINFNNYDESDVRNLQEWAFRVHDTMTAAKKLATE